MSRASIVGMLVAAEILVVGFAVYSLGGGPRMFGSGMHHVDFTPIALAPVSAGATPRVVVDDAPSRIRVAVSNDDLVHVRDLTDFHGGIFSHAPYAQLRVTRTNDGVRIERPAGEHTSISIGLFGFSTQAIEVLVPRASHVEIARCSGADVDGLSGGVSVDSQDGHVTLTDLQGVVDARSNDGYIEATNVRGDRLAMESMDGHLTLHDVTVGSLVATTHDGRIVASDLGFVGERPDATLHSDDGSVNLHLVPSSDLTINASTEDGRITIDGNSLSHEDSEQRTVRVGAGTGRMTVGTSDGSIHIFTSGALVQ
jgi:Putative adhesin